MLKILANPCPALHAPFAIALDQKLLRLSGLSDQRPALSRRSLVYRPMKEMVSLRTRRPVRRPSVHLFTTQRQIMPLLQLGEIQGQLLRTPHRTKRLKQGKTLNCLARRLQPPE